MIRPAKLPRDCIARAKMIVDISVGEVVVTEAQPLSAIQEMARQGGLKGGNARAAKLTAKRRSEIARKAAAARWGK